MPGYNGGVGGDNEGNNGNRSGGGREGDNSSWTDRHIKEMDKLMDIKNPKFDKSFFSGTYDPKKGFSGFLGAGLPGAVAGYQGFDDQGQMTAEDWGMVNSYSRGADNDREGGGSIFGSIPFRGVPHNNTSGVTNSVFNAPQSQEDLIQSMTDANRVDQKTAFGGTRWGDDGVESYLSPELQNLFNKQFDPNAYNQYGDDYMASAERHLAPMYDRQSEDFEQMMANRGQPVGGEEYNERYGLMMDAQNRGWQDAAFSATQAGDNARMQDYNRLMSAMNHNSVPVPEVNVLGAENLGLNRENLYERIKQLELDRAERERSRSDARSQQDSDNMWNTLTDLGGAYISTKPEWLYG